MYRQMLLPYGGFVGRAEISPPSEVPRRPKQGAPLASNERDLGDFLGAALKRKWTVLLIIVVVVGASVALPLTLGRTFTAMSSVSVGGVALEDPFSNLGSSADLQDRRMQTERSLARGASVAGAIREARGLRAKDLAVTVAPGSNSLLFSATATSEKEARAVAVEFAQRYVDVRQERLREIIDGEMTQLEARQAVLSDESATTTNKATSASLEAQAAALGENLASLYSARAANDAGALTRVEGPQDDDVTVSPRVSVNAAAGLVGGILLAVLFVLAVGSPSTGKRRRSGGGGVGRHPSGGSSPEGAGFDPAGGSKVASASASLNGELRSTSSPNAGSGPVVGVVRPGRDLALEEAVVDPELHADSGAPSHSGEATEVDVAGGQRDATVSRERNLSQDSRNG